jgi:hypothetical protein
MTLLLQLSRSCFHIRLRSRTFGRLKIAGALCQSPVSHIPYCSSPGFDPCDRPLERFSKYSRVSRANATGRDAKACGEGTGMDGSHRIELAMRRRAKWMCNRTHANPTKLGCIRSSKGPKHAKRLRKGCFDCIVMQGLPQLVSDCAELLIMIIMAFRLQSVVTGPHALE